MVAEWSHCSIAESDRCYIVQSQNRTVVILFNRKILCFGMFGRAMSRATCTVQQSADIRQTKQ